MNFPHFVLGIVDNNIEKKGNTIHSPRIPFDEKGETLFLQDVMLMHYQFTDWNRMKIKQAWYQCFERLTYPEKNSVDIYEMYNHFRYVRRLSKPCPEKWFQYYEQQGLDVRTIIPDPTSYYWVDKISEYVKVHGINKFKDLHIWESPLLGLIQGDTSPVKSFPIKLYKKVLEFYGGLPNRFYKRWLKKIIK